MLDPPCLVISVYEMVRNKNSNVSSAHPSTATASVTKQTNARSTLADVGQTLQDAQRSTSNLPHSSSQPLYASGSPYALKRRGPASPNKAKSTKDFFGSSNGILKASSNGHQGKNIFNELEKLASNDDRLLSCDTSPVKQLACNGFHNTGKFSDGGKRPEKSDPKAESGPELCISRMKAQPNVYRKMFGKYKDGDEVLARWSDGLYYLGVICEVFDHGLRCQMQFEDESRFWVHFKDLHHISNSEVGEDGDDAKDQKEDGDREEEESDVTCVLCRDGASDPPNEIVLCDKCGQGYHQHCHKPHIDSTVLKDEEVPWQCRNCVFSACVRRGGAIKHGLGEVMKQMKCVFPYDLNSLTWNRNHKINDEEKYCYCGGPGDWYLKMLQCSRCFQWFHEACLQCLESPIIYGDRFFLFVCAVCNNGNEFIKRLPLKWVDVVHLVLYNITIAKKVKYYDVDFMISFFNKHMESLRLGDMAKEIATRSHLRQKVCDTLQSNKSRFQFGTECKKSKVTWGLRNRSPPVPPSISLPPGIEINDETFESLDLKHGSSLSDSPTPLKKQGPCEVDGAQSPRADGNKQHAFGRSPVKDLVKSGLLNLGSTLDDASKDHLFGSDDMPPPKRRKGRPKKSDAALPPAGSLKRSSSSSSLCSSSKFSWPPSRTRKRKFSEVSRGSAGSGRASDAGSSVARLWGTGASSTNDGASSCSSGSSEHRPGDGALRDAVARYFGAEERVQSGEKFRVCGRRVVRTAQGACRFEYLIEWEGYTPQDLEAMKKV